MSVPSLGHLGSNLGWLAGNRLIRMAIGVVVLGYVGRALGPEQFGMLNYALSLVAIFATVANLGIDGIVIRELVRSPVEAPQVLGTALVLRLVGGALGVLLAGASGWASGVDPLTQRLVWICALSFLPMSFEVIDLWFQKTIQARYTVIARVGAALLGAGARLALVYGEAPLSWFAWAVVLDGVLNAVALLWVFRLRGQFIRAWRVSWPRAREILRDSWPLILSGILVATYTRIEQVLVMDFLGTYSMGIYSAAARVTEMWNFIPGIVLGTLYPILVQKRQEDPVGYRRRLQSVFNLMTALGYLLALGVTLTASWVIPLVYGREYVAAVPILVIQAWTAPIYFNGAVRGHYFLLENKNVHHIWTALLGIAANVLLATLLMPEYGARGAALAALLAGVWAGFGSSWMAGELRECAWLQGRAFLAPWRLKELLSEYRAR